MARANPIAASSTDPRESFPFAMTLAEAGPAILPDLARAIGASVPTIDACRGALEDPARTRARFLALPAYAAVAVEILAEVGGEAEGTSLASEAARRTGMAATEVLKLLGTIGIAQGNVLVLDRALGGQKTRSFVLIAEGARAAARLVRGVTSRGEAPPAAQPGRVHRDVRDRIALATLIAHRALKLTMDGYVHRASLKSFVKGIGVEPDRAERLLQQAMLENVVVRCAPEAVASLSLDTLASVVTTGSGTELDEDLRSLVPADRWVSLEAASRALASGVLAQRGAGPKHGNTYRHPAEGLYFARAYRPAEVAATLPNSAVVELLEHRGAAWIRRRGPRGLAEETGDGHVTPSFDVMLGPGASLSVVAAVGLGAALTRLDQVLTFQIGPRSVEAGLAAGMDPGAFLSALQRVGRHGLPDNVRAMVDDWIKNAKFASAASVLLVRVSERAEAAVVKALGGHCLGRIRPGQLVVGPRSAAKAIGAKLQQLGLPVSLPDDWLKKEEPGELFAPPRRVFEPHLPPWPEPEPAIAARYDAAKARGFKDDLALLTARAAAPAPAPAPRPPPPAAPRPPPPAAPRAPEPRAAAASDPIEVAHDRADALAAPLFDACRAEIAGWIQGLDPFSRAEALLACEFPLLWAPLLALASDYRQRAFKRAPSIPDLFVEAWRLCGGSRRSPRGIELMAAVMRATVDRELFFEGVESLADVVRDERTASGSALAYFTPRGGASTIPSAPVAPEATGKPAAKAPQARPTATHPDAVRKWMIRAHQKGTVLELKVGSRESTVRVTGVRTQGQETIFLVVDTTTDEGRAVRLDSIASVALADDPDGPSPAP